MSTYAIVETGSKQYRVEENSILDVEKLDLPEKKKDVTLEKVLLIRDGKGVQVGTPVLKGAKVVCENLGAFRGPKLIHFRYRRRKASKKKIGHRQELIKLRVKKIQSS